MNSSHVEEIARFERNASGSWIHPIVSNFILFRGRNLIVNLVTVEIGSMTAFPIIETILCDVTE